MKLNTYLTFNGNCEEALGFYEKVLGAKRVMLMRYSDGPPETQCSKEMASKVMHGRITIGDNVIMASDAAPERFHAQHGFSVNISVDSPEEAERIYAALSAKAKDISMPLEETFWAQRFAMFVDQFGVPWMINCEKKM
jgi:PhnB protein